MDKVRLATDERVDLVDALRLGSLTEDALMRLVQVFFGQTDSGYTTLSSDEAVTTPIMPVIWEPVQIATATQTALPIDISTNPATLTLELRKSGSRQARIWAGDGNQLSGANASGTVAFSVAAGTASGIYYIKVRRREDENRGFPGASESRMYISRSTQQESGAATNTKLLDEWEVSTALSTSAAPSGRYFAVAAFEVALSGGVQKVVAITNLAGSTTGTFSAAPASFAWKRAKTHAWSSRTTAAQDSFRTLKDVYDAITTAISEMRDGQLWLVDPATQAKFNSGGGVKLSNGAVIGITGTGVQIADGGAGTPVTLQVYDGQVIFAKGGATYFVGDALTAGRTLWASQDTTRTLRIQTARANTAGNVPMEQRWPVAGVPAPNTYLDRYLTTTSGGAEREHARINAWTGHWESPHAKLEDDFIGPLDINIGDRSRLVWSKDTLAANASDVELSIGSSLARWNATRTGSITGVTFRLQTYTTGTITIKVRRGTTTIVTAFSATATQDGRAVYFRGLYGFAAGEDINVTYSSNGTFDGQNLTVVLDIEDSDERGLWKISPFTGTPSVLKQEFAGGHGSARLATRPIGASGATGDSLVLEPADTAFWFATGYTFIYKARLYLNNLDSVEDPRTQIALSFGLFASATANALFLLFKGATPATFNYFAGINVNDATFVEDPGTSTGIAVSTATWQDFEIWVGPSSTVFIINSAVVATLGGLTATNGNFAPRLRLATQSAVGDARVVNLDYVRVYATRGAL